MRYSGLLSDAIDDGLSALGQSPKEAIYEVLKTDFSMRRTDIPRRFVEFSSILRENIGPGATPLLEFIVDRFSQGLHIKFLSSINLDESIKRVDMILKGNLTLPEGGDHASRRASIPTNGKTIDDASDRLTHSQPSFPGTNRSIAVKTSSQETDKRMLERTKGRRHSRGSSVT